MFALAIECTPDVRRTRAYSIASKPGSLLQKMTVKNKGSVSKREGLGDRYTDMGFVGRRLLVGEEDGHRAGVPAVWRYIGCGVRGGGRGRRGRLESRSMKGAGNYLRTRVRRPPGQTMTWARRNLEEVVGRTGLREVCGNLAAKMVVYKMVELPRPKHTINHSTPRLKLVYGSTAPRHLSISVFGKHVHPRSPIGPK
jgi:hypothetical protein